MINTNKRKSRLFIGEFTTPKKNDLLLANTILLVLFKNVYIISYPTFNIISKNLLKT